MRVWERRLLDLSHFLAACHSTYFDPDLFRRNTNQFLQTARTITFIIQKNKDEIPNYQTWYAAAVSTPWGADELMQWAKNARNIIEKEGDLELNSLLNVTLLFSYLEEEDLTINCGRDELLNAGVKKLFRLAQKRLPTGVADAAAAKIERRWVTASLPRWELLHALCYIYARIFDCCRSLAQHLGERLSNKIPGIAAFDEIGEDARHIRYIKLNGLQTYTIGIESFAMNRAHEPPEPMRAALKAFKERPTPPNSFAEALDFFAGIAAFTFGHFGNHVPMLFILNERWEPIDILSTQFADQTDKFIFWRNVADRLVTLKASGLVWICEAWTRSVDLKSAVAVRNLPIVGERLHVLAIDKSGRRDQVGWEIVRTSERPTLHPIQRKDEKEDEAYAYFLVPAMRALGIPDPDFLTKRKP